MSKTVLFIDGENIRHYLITVLRSKGIVKDKIDIENFDYSGLFNRSLKGIRISEKRFYSAKLRVYENTLKKSRELILKQRILKTNLEKQGFSFILSGNVRPQEIRTDGKIKVIFKEKGVDVRIAVDLVANACDKSINTAILCSSDSDLQPAVKEVMSRKTEVVYLGFEINPNKGLSYTTNRTILIRNSEVIETYKNLPLINK
ncbi:MAG: NYN domain-containing protein [Patescibacteria group bacterium]